jgi:23S rRNA pseudouridine2605 synthase
MIDSELQSTRLQKWRLDGRAVRTLEDARDFIESVGFCLLYPLRPAILLPTFVGAYVGSDDRLPTVQHAFSDPRAQEATELMVRLLRERAAYEANLFDENNNFLVAGSVFPYFYALVGERNPKQPPKAGARSEYSQLAVDAFEVIRQKGPISKQKLREELGGDPSLAALDRALAELWSKLRITRVDYSPAEGASWDELFRWSPDVVREGMNLSVASALSALISKYLDSVVAAEPAEVESLFSNLVPRSRVKEAVNALLAARELSFVHVGNRSLIQITPPRTPSVPQEPKVSSAQQRRRLAIPRRDR